MIDRVVICMLSPALLLVALASHAEGPTRESIDSDRRGLPRELDHSTPAAVSFGSYRAAADSLRAVVSRTLGISANDARWKDEKSDFGYSTGDEYRDVTVRKRTFFVATEEGYDYRDVERALQSAGWVRDPHYQWDRGQGTAFVMACREPLCWIGADWDEGDDTDSTSVETPGTSIELQCVPRPPAHKPNRP